jgi:hypothetical protein
MTLFFYGLLVDGYFLLMAVVYALVCMAADGPLALCYKQVFVVGVRVPWFCLVFSFC